MKRRGTLLLLGLAVVGAATLPCLAQQDKTDTRMPLTNKTGGGSSIAGRVMLPSGLASAAHVKITLTTIEAPVMTLYSDGNGEFTFSNVHAGTYYLQVFPDAEMYEQASQKLWVNPGEPAYVILYLKERRGAAVKRTGTNIVSAGESDSDPSASARREFEQARKLIREGAIDDAIEHLRRALTIDPAYVIARNDLGVQYLRQKRYEEAGEQFTSILERNPKYFNAQLNLGIVFVEMKKFAEAIEHLDQAVTLDSSQPAAHLFRGIAALDSDDLPTAEKEIVKALVLGGEQYSIAHYYFAHVYLKYGRRKEAGHELRLFLKTAPQGEMMVQAQSMLRQLPRE
jgi:tetratricopeptide (TPR) repeat protein